MTYLSWNEQTIADFSEKNISGMFDDGYVFTRIGKGVMQQTQSLRIDLSKFTLSSENRRIFKKTEGLELTSHALPYDSYNFTLGKLGKDFYDTKFGSGVMSAQKIKEMLTDETASNFNLLLSYSLNNKTIGYVICHQSESLLHYSYPFYDLASAPADMGMGMMLRAIIYAQEKGLKYIYLGSLQRPGDTYKLQFEGLEWFDGKEWSTDLEKAKEVLKVM